MNWHANPATPDEILDNARYHAGRGEFTASRALPPGGPLYPDEGAVMRDYIDVLAALTASRQRAEEMEKERDEADRELSAVAIAFGRLNARAESAERERDQERAARGEAERKLADQRDIVSRARDVHDDFTRPEVDEMGTSIRRLWEAVDSARLNVAASAAPCPPNAGATEAGA